MDLLKALADLDYLDSTDSTLLEMHDRILGKGAHFVEGQAPLNAGDCFGLDVREEVYRQIGKFMVTDHRSKIHEAAVS